MCVCVCVGGGGSVLFSCPANFSSGFFLKGDGSPWVHSLDPLEKMLTKVT